jgi:hypothetical protein
MDMIMVVLCSIAPNVINIYFNHLDAIVGYALAVARGTQINGHIR